MPSLTREQARQIDRLAIEEYGIPALILMENAGKNAAQIIAEYCQHNYHRSSSTASPISPQTPSPHRRSKSKMAIVCGGGNNGGDGLVIARHLHNQGFDVRIILFAQPHKLSVEFQTNLTIVQKMNLPIEIANDMNDRIATLLSEADGVIDALLGTGFVGPLRPPLDRIIREINARSACILAIDIPSGLDCNTGQPGEPTIRAQLTITFVAAKTGFSIALAPQYTGLVVIADIGAPRHLLDLV